MSDSGMEPHDLKARHTLVKSWLFPLLACEQDKVASQKGLVLFLFYFLSSSFFFFFFLIKDKY